VRVRAAATAAAPSGSVVVWWLPTRFAGGEEGGARIAGREMDRTSACTANQSDWKEENGVAPTLSVSL
jgi:hypothetical protein